MALMGAYYKRTMKKVKLMSRTVRLIHREAEASMIATQLLLCQGALAMPVASSRESTPVMCSPRKVLLEIRRDITGHRPKGKSFGERLAKAQRERCLMVPNGTETDIDLIILKRIK